MSTTTIIASLFDNYDDAAGAIRALEAENIRDISIIANNADGGPTRPGDGTEIGTGAGDVAGVSAGPLAGLGMLAIPGIGPVVAAGWLVTTAAGAAVDGPAGSTAGSLVGSMVECGVSEDHAHLYAEGIRRGGAVVLARVAPAERALAEDIMRRHKPVDGEQRAGAYRKAGWRKFEPSAAPYTLSDIERMRAH